MWGIRDKVKFVQINKKFLCDHRCSIHPPTPKCLDPQNFTNSFLLIIFLWHIYNQIYTFIAQDYVKQKLKRKKKFPYCIQYNREVLPINIYWNMPLIYIYRWKRTLNCFKFRHTSWDDELRLCMFKYHTKICDRQL